MLTDVARRLGARGFGVFLLALALFSGCSPDGLLVTDEERERNFQRARDAERLGDFTAAADHYENALERNPRAANVTLGYAALCETHLKRFADAIYLYQRYLKLVPNDPRADDIKRRITICSERLASSVPVLVRSETIARDLEAVRNENSRLQLLASNLTATAIYWSNEWRRAASAGATPSTPAPAPAAASVANAASPAPLRPQAVRTPSSPAPTGRGSTTPASGRRGSSDPAMASAANPPPTASPSSTSAQDAGYAVESRSGRPATTTSRPPTPNPTRAAAAAPERTPSRGPVRMHVVSSGDTIESIARRFGVSASAIAQANPRLDTRRLSSGTIVRIPVGGGR